MEEPRGYDFEFERKFFVRSLPTELTQEPDPSLIVQGYFLAVDGYGLRLRLQADNCPARVNSCDRRILEEHQADFTFAALTLKGPAAGGTRYEVEREIDVSVALQMLRRGGSLVAKHRFSLWHGADGWVIDEFLGENAPLLLAEVERGTPVVDLEIPSFCVSEVTDDLRFLNDNLVHYPYCQWQEAWEQELAATGPKFHSEFGVNN